MISEGLRLANGVIMPPIGLGVFRTERGDQTQQSITHALQAGYRHFDTARVYGNEADVGAALAASGIARSDYFVTTKLWNQDHGYEEALRAFEVSRRALGVDVIDLYLLHWPVPGRRLDSWRALESLYESGQVRAIGVSNFMVPHLEELQAHARIQPMVNQIEVHPFLQQREVRQWCENRHVMVAAYSPLAKATALSHPVVQQVAQENGISPAQALLAWGLQQGHAVLPKSVNPQRQAENFAALSIRLPVASLQKLDALESGMVTGWDPRSVL